MKDKIRREASTLDPSKEIGGEFSQTREVSPPVPEAPSRLSVAESDEQQDMVQVTPDAATVEPQERVPTAGDLISPDSTERVSKAGTLKAIGLGQMKRVEEALGELYEQNE